ncbi:hypothetical protein HPB47_017046 [Ixodes persulcatus]|uniref:Uncharacterized protein n=1 Tax=Ixodes persulcatus TaxID=34615 RepID=A0AC60QPB3_IXOPE|nr:hypothetical protein HPB47_017046 [Ixodes persulcatus]
MFQITLGMGQLLERLDQLAQNAGTQTQSMDRIAQNIQEGVLSMQENTAFMRECAPALDVCADLTDEEIARQVLEPDSESDSEDDAPAIVRPSNAELTQALMPFFLNGERKPKRDHFASNGYHVSRFVGIWALSRLINVAARNRLGARWVGDRPRLEITELYKCCHCRAKGHKAWACLDSRNL